MEDAHYIPSEEERKTPKEKAEEEVRTTRRRSASEMLRDIMAGRDAFGREKEPKNPDDDEEEEDDEESLEGGVQKKRKKRFTRKFSKLFRSRIAVKAESQEPLEEGPLSKDELPIDAERSQGLGLNFFDVMRSQSSHDETEEGHGLESGAKEVTLSSSAELVSDEQDVSVADILREVSDTTINEDVHTAETAHSRTEASHEPIAEPEAIGAILSRQSSGDTALSADLSRTSYEVSSEPEADHDRKHEEILHAAKQKAVRASATAFVGAELLSRSRDKRLDAKIEAQENVLSRAAEQQVIQEQINRELMKKSIENRDVKTTYSAPIEKMSQRAPEKPKAATEIAVPKVASPEVAERHVRAIEQVERDAAAEAVPEIVLKSVEKAAEKNIPIEQLFERRHEVKGSVDPVDRSFFKDQNDDARRKLAAEELLREQQQYEAEQKEQLLKLAAEANNKQSSMYQQAATTGFWVAVILIVIFMLFYAASSR